MKFEVEDLEEKKEKVKKKKDKRFIIIVAVLLGVLLILLGYYFLIAGKEETKVIKKPKVVEKKKIKIVDEDSNQRPIAIMIDNNIGQARHAGLQESYINYEIIVEGGLTRIMAVYKDRDVKLIGPVRSSRHYFLDYAKEHDAVYAHYGWSPYAERDIKALGINNINGMYDEAPYSRDTTLRAPHNVFTSTEKMRSYFDKKGYDKETDDWKLLKYSADEINLDKKDKKKTEEEAEENTEVEYKTANKVSMDYSNHQVRSYTYDTENKYYLRAMNGQPHMDKVTSEQLHYKNIIIIKVNNKTLDSYGRQDLDTVGSGEGFYITNGYALPIKWSKETRKSKTTLTYNDGKKVKVNDGNTFIQIVPTFSNIVME